MTGSIFIIKTALLRFGVVIEEVKFDIDNEAIVVNYLKKGKKQSKSVPFSDIEDLFTFDSNGPAGPEAGDPTPPGR